MVWGCFSSAGVGKLCELDGILIAVKYIKVLEDYMLPLADAKHGVEFNKLRFFLKDGAVHRAHATLNWLDSLEVNRMLWKAVSPDLNPIENIWGIMAQEVPKHGRQFGDKARLRQAVFHTWENIGAETLDQIKSSMRGRCV